MRTTVQERQFRTAVASALAAFLASAGCSSTDSVPTTPKQTTPLAQVTNISVVVTQSGVEIRASVVLPTCTVVGDTTQSRSGNIVDVAIPAVSSATGQMWVCLSGVPAGVLVSEVSVLLRGAFPPGDYVVRVNGVAQPFHVDG